MTSTNAKPSRTRAKEPPPRTEEERLRLARERAQEYRNESPGRTPWPPGLEGEVTTAPEETDLNEIDPEEEDVPQTLEEWQNLVSRRVDDAMRQGMFDNLPGQGKPQSLKRDPFIPEDQQMAYNLMKKNQITPGWIGDRKSILAAIETLRGEMRELAHFYWVKAEQTQAATERVRLAHQWDGCVAAWEERVIALNEQILNLNLSQPFHFLEVYKLRLDEELKRAGGARFLPVD